MKEAIKAAEIQEALAVFDIARIPSIFKADVYIEPEGKVAGLC